MRFADLDLSDLESQLSERTRVVAFPWASNALGTLVDAERICRLAHEAGALAWVDAVHYAPHGPIDVASVGADVLLCSPYKFYGPHLGLAFVRRDLLQRWRPYKVRPAPGYETGTQHELLAGFVAAVKYIESLGWDAITAHERELGQRFLDGLPANVRLYGPHDGGPCVDVCAHRVRQEPRGRRGGARRRGIFVWHGDYYAVEVMKRLGLADGAVRVGIVHYNTADEVDRLLAELRASRGRRPPFARPPRRGARARVAPRRRLVDRERHGAVGDHAGLGPLAQEVGEEAVHEPFAAGRDRRPRADAHERLAELVDAVDPGSRMKVVGPSGRICKTDSTISIPRSRSVTKTSSCSSLTPLSTRTDGICELWMWITSPSSVRSRVCRSETSSTIPCSSCIGIWIVSPTEYQRSMNITSPAMMSISTRWIAKPTRMSRNEAPASAVRRSTPPISWPTERTAAVANPR